MSLILNMNGGGGGGDAYGFLTVTAPIGVTATVSKDDKTKTKIVGDDGIVVFKGLATGTWILTITNGSQVSTKPVVITADYSTTIKFFASTVNITYPKGSTCTCSDGTTTFTAHDTSGTWECIVPNTGTWTVSCTDGTHKDSESVSITADGQNKSVTLKYFAATINITYPAGSTCTCTDGTNTFNAPDTSGAWACVVPNTGTWTVSCTDGIETASGTVEITADGQSESLALSYWNGELYVNGDQFTNITGGWSASGWSIAGVSSGIWEPRDASIGSSEIAMTTASEDEPYGVFSGNEIDLRGYSKLSFTVKSVSTANAYLIVNNKKEAPRNFEDFSVLAYAQLSVGTKTLNISGIDSGYIAAYIWSTGSTQTCKITDMHLEK